MGFIFGEVFDEFFVLYLERYFLNSFFLLRVECELCRFFDIVFLEFYIKEKFINKLFNYCKFIINIYLLISI